MTVFGGAENPARIADTLELNPGFRPENENQKKSRILVYGHVGIFSEIENIPKCPQQLQSGFSAYSLRVTEDAQLLGTLE